MNTPLRSLLMTMILVLWGSFALAQSSSPTGYGGGGRFDFRKKAESKEGKRWTLQEWLEQRDRNYMMDLWLGMYAPSPYEFYLGGAFQTYDKVQSPTTTNPLEVKTSHESGSGRIGAYALIMGLQGEYENNWKEGYNDTSGSLNLRLLGNAVQGTHLIVHYGLRTRQMGDVVLRQQFAGADLDLYLMKYFGLHGLYRAYLPTNEKTLGDVSGSRTEGGVFIDFGPMRVFGNWFSEKQENKPANVTVPQSTDRTGIQSGLLIFF